jgi:hypothetical protein
MPNSPDRLKTSQADFGEAALGGAMAGAATGWIGGLAAATTGVIHEIPGGPIAVLLCSVLGVMLGGVSGACVGAVALAVAERIPTPASASARRAQEPATGARVRTHCPGRSNGVHPPLALQRGRHRRSAVRANVGRLVPRFRADCPCRRSPFHP